MASATLVQDSSVGNTCPVPFTFQDHQIRTVMVDEQPWFVAKDVCGAMTIPWRGDTLRSIPADWSTMRSFRIDGKNRQVKVISEPAVYKLAFRSNKPEADAFTNWVASEVLPAIRKTGQFAAPVQALPIGPLTPAQCRHLHDVIDAKVSALPKEVHRAAYAEAWTRFNRHFRIAKYEQLPQEKFSDGLSYLISMQVKAAQKALPAATPPPALPEPDDMGKIESAVTAIEVFIAEADCMAGSLFQRINDRFGRRNMESPATFSQMRYLIDEVFNSLGHDLMTIRRLALTAKVAAKELAHRQ